MWARYFPKTSPSRRRAPTSLSATPIGGSGHRLEEDGSRGSFEDANFSTPALLAVQLHSMPLMEGGGHTERIPSPPPSFSALQIYFGEPETERLIKRPSRSPSGLLPRQ
ncbi:hypothetical protein NDU88_011337 [Pleurodeles waltl]|uniref:Uncharacterized protein n=1 Tax=Pleurodeles waltl TaxID=8319 RepID=A0AAV7Q113_PLEWA|nr:hypothetical protein NDU88_011337 [Pleurodeles waltl]